FGGPPFPFSLEIEVKVPTSLPPPHTQMRHWKLTNIIDATKQDTATTRAIIAWSIGLGLTAIVVGALWLIGKHFYACFVRKQETNNANPPTKQKRAVKFDLGSEEEEEEEEEDDAPGSTDDTFSIDEESLIIEEQPLISIDAK